MPRPLSYELGRAGAETLNGMDADRERSSRLASEQARKAANSEWRRQVAEDELARRTAANEAQEKIAKAHADLEHERLLTKSDRTQKILEQATGFLRDARGMDPSKSEFDRQYRDLTAGYPQASEHPSVKEWMDYHRPLRDKYVASELAAKAKADAEKAAADAKALAAGAKELGSITTKTKDAAGNTISTTRQRTQADVDAAQTAQTEALKTQHAALETQLMSDKSWLMGSPKPEDVAAINAVKSKLGYDLLGPDGKVAPKAAGAPSTAAVVPTPAAAIVIPDAAAAHLRDNPALASDFDAKFGEGSSSKILGK